MPARPRLDAAESLRARLASAFAVDGRKAFWGEPQAMTRALEDVRKRHDSAATRPVAADRIRRAVESFRRERRVTGYVQLRHVCLGAASIEVECDCLIADPALRARLFDLAVAVPGARRQIKCFQALLRAWWSFPRFGDISQAAAEGAEALRAWLRHRYVELNEAMARKPLWFALLGEHPNLLEDKPCERYGAALLRGDAQELQTVIDGLAIPSDSWVKQEAVLAQARAAAALGDADWLAILPQLLDIAEGKAGVAVSPRLRQRCVALYLARHAHCAAVEREERLLDAAIAAIGNPWQRRAAWDALVLEADGRPSELAREMVNGWLKEFLIGEFFRLHGGEDSRRAAYWQRFDPFIAGLWIGLGSAAMERRGEASERFARRAAGCLLLVDSDSEDNALLIRIDDFLLVEFGAAARGLSLYRWNELDGKLLRRLGSAREARFFSLSTLAAAQPEARLAHRDEAGLAWESRFDERLRPLLWRGR